MLMWIIILIVLVLVAGAAIFYQCRMWQRFDFIRRCSYSWWRLSMLGGQIVALIIFGVMWLATGLMNAVIACLYLALYLVVADILGWCLNKCHFLLKANVNGNANANAKTSAKVSAIVALVATMATLIVGWQQAHEVSLTKYEFHSAKAITPLKVGLLADAHIGTTFSGKELINKLAPLLSSNPEVIVIAGDFVDDDTTLSEMQDAVKALSKIKTTYGVVFFFGNHDAGYYGAKHRGFSREDLIKALTENGIKVLIDEVMELNSLYYIVGREDRVEEHRGQGRKSAKELVSNLDLSRYIIMVDHQPNDYTLEAEAKVDLVLSGHTHGGQLWPINRLGEWIGANDLTVGTMQKGDTNFVVTSGISDWAIRYKTGTSSEVVLLEISGTPEQK